MEKAKFAANRSSGGQILGGGSRDVSTNILAQMSVPEGSTQCPVMICSSSASEKLNSDHQERQSGPA
jgi:hypothetical protein